MVKFNIDSVQVFKRPRVENICSANALNSHAAALRKQAAELLVKKGNVAKVLQLREKASDAEVKAFAFSHIAKCQKFVTADSDK